MTKEEFDAIRARVLTTYFNNGGFNGCFIDVTNLLAEVERLTAELHCMKSRPVEAEFSRLDTMWQQLVRERDDAVHELRRLKAERDALIRWRDGWLAVDEMCVSEGIAAAFRRGVAAMRMAAARYLYSMALTDDAEAVRALPDPEDKP